MEIDGELRKYADNIFADFVISGVTDEKWNAYVETCKDYGCEEMIQILQNRWNQFNAE